MVNLRDGGIMGYNTHTLETRKLAKKIMLFQQKQIYHRKKWLEYDLKINHLRYEINQKLNLPTK